MYTPSLREADGKAIGFTPLHPVSSNVKTNSLHQRSSDGDVTGFTLLELLIVIGIMVILGTVLVLVLNPAETLKKSRDNQRITDMATMKTAIGLYLTDVSSTDLDAGVTNGCLGTNNTAARVFYSLPGADTSMTCAVDIAEGADVDADDTYKNADFCFTVVSPTNTLVNGTGWLPVNLTGISGGSPLSNYPLDPTNTMSNSSTPASTDLVYRYACQQGTMSGSGVANVFELNAQLESTAYTSTDDKRTKDGGDNTAYYEVGNNLKLLPATSAINF